MKPRGEEKKKRNRWRNERREKETDGGVSASFYDFPAKCITASSIDLPSAIVQQVFLAGALYDFSRTNNDGYRVASFDKPEIPSDR